MNYYYNEKEKSFARTRNFEYNSVPKGYKKITKAKYEELKEELRQKQETSEQTETTD